ncbi:transporter substrate-binding domain-containing protein [Pararhizobium antarcticum]|uniref:Amino acid ABC transporter n=1 Tax=Pararhizobium antarcticum TaxID=1798805 RepID=A0A657M2D9_9HYPH|nr:transporter substrate-binding domain-containing protein [Pararhizobium antarcticum]OJF98514.1 amino acid ABC transporter [Rhizobium sp. 58]OJG01042.1 amino acid ABC transporter [Pararhizobium antarcticum]
MRRAVYSSLKFYGLFALNVFLVVVSGGFVHAADGVLREMPTLFDSRERIAKPDLTGLARLRFLTTVDFPPFNFIDQSGKLAGYHVDLVREICRLLAIEKTCEIQAVTFSELQSALAEGQGEAVVAGIAITPEMRQRFAFSRVFMTLPARFVANVRVPGRAAAVEALSGKPVGVVAGTTHEAMLKAFFPDIQARAFPTRADMLAQLQTGAIPAVFSDGMQLSFWVSGGDAAGCCALLDGAYFSQRFLGEGLSIMNRKEDPVLTQAIDHALLALSRNGRLNEIYLRYFPNGIF